MTDPKTTAGQTFVSKSGAERFVPNAELKRYASNPDWNPKSGKVRVAVDGKVRDMSIVAYRLAQEVGGGSTSIELVGDDIGGLLEVERAGEQARLEQKVAEESGGTALVTSASPIPAGAVARGLGLLTGDVAADSKADMATLRDANVGETMVGSAAQFALTTALTGGALGAAAKAGKMGAFFQQSKTATQLFGFADDAGNLVSAGLMARNVAAPVANLIGAGARSALLTAPGAVVYEAAIRADTDPEYTAESWSSAVGTDMVLGMVIDLGLSAMGPVGRGLKTAGSTAWRLSPIKTARNALKGYRVAKYFGGDGDPLFKAEMLATLLSHSSTKNAAARRVVKEQLEEAAEAGVTRARITKALHPAALSGRRKLPKDLDDLLDAAQGSMKVDPLDVVAARESAGDIIGLRAGVGKMENTANQVASNGSGHISSLSMKMPIPRAGDVRVDLALSASELRSALPRDAADELFQELDTLTALGPGVSRRESVKRVVDFRNKAIANESPAVRSAVKERIDSVLKDPDIMGADGALQLADILDASEIFLDAAKKTAGLSSNLKNLDTIVDDVPLGALGANVDEMAKAYGRLADLGAVGANDKRFLQGRINAALDQLEKLAPQLEGAAAMNRVRNSLAGEGDILLHTPGAGTSAEQLAAAKTEANVLAAQDTENLLQKFAKSPGAKLGYRGGIYAYRTLNNRADKEQAYLEATSAVQAATGTPEDMVRVVSTMTKNIMEDPEFASVVQQRTVAKLQYLRAQIPTPPMGVVPQPGSVYASPAEVSNFLEILGAADDPVSVMASALEGTLNESALATIEALFPVQTAGLRVEVTQILQDTEFSSKLTYQQRLSLDHFAGGGREFAATPGALVIQSNRSAQTQAQEAAQRGRPSVMKSKATQLSTVSDRLTAL